MDIKRRAALLLVAALLAGILPVPGTPPVQAADYGLCNPRIEHSITTWDCIWFGNYWQEDTDGDGKTNKNDEKTPIKWRVLSVEGDDAFLVADKSLDCQKYNLTYKSVTWGTCTLRSWLNGYGADQNICSKDYSSENFMDEAFTAEEREAVQTTDVVNSKNPSYNTTGGSNTRDAVYLLSIDEVANSAYGFSSLKSRSALNTDFVNGRGAFTTESETYAGNGYWWLRSPGRGSSYASYMGSNGNVDIFGHGVSTGDSAVRPALHLNLSSVRWSAAGTVTSEGEGEEILPAPQISATPTAAPGASQNPSATAQPGTTPVSQKTYDLRLKLSGNGSVALQISKTVITTDGSASIDMKIKSGEDVQLTFQPEDGSAPYTFTIDGEKGQAEENIYRIPDVQSSHTVVVTFAGSTPAPTPVVTPPLAETPEPPGPTQTPMPTETPVSTEEPVISASPLPPAETPEPPGPTQTPMPTETPVSTEEPVISASPLPPAMTPEPKPSPSPVRSPKPTPKASPSYFPEKDLSDIRDGLGVSPDTAVKIQAAAKELDVSMDTILVTEQTIQSQKTDEDIKGAYFARIQARASQITEKNIKLSWNRVKGADGYEVYGNRCNTKKWIYEYKLKKNIKNGDKKSYIDRKCKKGTYFKYIVRAYKIIDRKKVTIAASKTIHVTTKGGKNGNAKSVKVNKNKVILKVGKTWRIKAKEIKESKPLRHHREVSYESSRPQALSVSKKGVIKAKKKGKYTVFAYAQSGVYRKVQITVK